MSTYYNQDFLLEMENKITKLEEENRQLKQLLGMIGENVKDPAKLTCSQAIFKLEAVELYTKSFVQPTSE